VSQNGAVIDDYLLLLAHLLGATVWTGGHVVLTFAVLPRALQRRDPSVVTAFETRFERLGLPALAVQTLTGLVLAHRWLGGLDHVFDDDGAARAILLKLVLLLATVALAAHARLRLIPRLDDQTLPRLAWHIRLVTLIGVLFVVVGASIRYGGAPILD
jgi:putative copper export protein